MKTTSKVTPGLSLDGNMIRSRLRNRTLSKVDPSKSEYIQSDDLIRISRMNKVEREMEHRKLKKEAAELHKQLEYAQTAKESKLQEERINKLVEERLKQLRNEKPIEPNSQG